MSLANRIALVEYDVAGPVLNHERLILDHIEHDDYIVCTPDRDLYAETMSALNQDLRAFRVRPRANVLPAGVNAAQVYALPNWNAAELAAIRADASVEAIAERQRRNIAPGGAGGAAAVAVAPAAVGGGPGVPSAVPVADQCPGARDIHGEQGVWVFAETDGECRYGGLAAGVQDAPVVGDKTIHVLPNGKKVFCMCVNEKTVEEFNNKPSGCCSEKDECVGITGDVTHRPVRQVQTA